MGKAIDFTPKTKKDELTKFYVPLDEWEGEYYPPDEYTGTAVKQSDAFIYAMTHITDKEWDAFEEWCEYDYPYECQDLIEFYFNDWTLVTYEEMCPNEDDYYNPKDTGHGYWDFY